MKKHILCFMVILLVGLWGTGAFAFERALGDLGKPDDYEQSIKRFRLIFPDFSTRVEQLPPAFDWSDHGIVTSAKDQGTCGSCWAFVSVGALESKIMMDGDPEYDLSEQQQVSCNSSMYGCCGGSMSALKFWNTEGPMEESCTGYGDYTTHCPPTYSGVPCGDLNSCSRLSYNTMGYYTVDMGDINEIKTSIYNDGPTYFRFNVYGDFSTFWNTGNPGDVYTQSSGSILLGGHAVLIIGWDDSKSAWLCKNSWGATSGPNGDGTFWIAYSGHVHNLGFGMANIEVTSAPPVPDIKTNGSDGPLLVAPAESVNLTISLDPGDMAGEWADWWGILLSSYGTFPLFGFQAPLFELPETSLFDIPLPPGWYVFLFNLDDTPDLSFDLMWHDYVVVVCLPAGAEAEELPDFDAIIRKNMKEFYGKSKR